MKVLKFLGIHPMVENWVLPTAEEQLLDWLFIADFSIEKSRNQNRQVIKMSQLYESYSMSHRL